MNLTTTTTTTTGSRPEAARGGKARPVANLALTAAAGVAARVRGWARGGAEHQDTNMARRGRPFLIAAVALAGVVFTDALPARAAGDFQLTLPAGMACPGFGVSISGTGGNYATRSFVNGRTVSAGTGFSLVFTNVSTGQTFKIRSNGAAQQTTTNADGTQTVASEGHRVLILFPTDAPAGPSTTLIVGRVVYDIDTAGNFIVKSISGRTTDICAQIS